MNRIARIVALPFLSAGVIGGAALGLAGTASASVSVNDNGGIVPPWLSAPQSKNPGIVPPWLQKSPVHILPIGESEPVSPLPVEGEQEFHILPVGGETQFVSTPISASPMTLVDALRAR